MAPRSRPVVAALFASVLLTTAVSCSSNHPSPKVSVQSSPALSAPSTTSSGSGSPAPSPTGTSDRDQVSAAYNGYWAASKKAGLSPIDQAAAILAPYSTPELIAIQVKELKDVQAKHQEPWGDVVIHLYSVQVTGATASLGDCQDDSGAGLADSRTHQLIPGARGGTQPVNLSVTLHRGADGRWRVASVQPVGATCSTSGTGS